MSAATRRLTGTYLDRILDNTVAEVESRRAAFPFAEVEQRARRMPATVPFARALHSSGVTVIAELKRASPSRGPIALEAVASDVAHEYISGGAEAISVLTDERFFRGSLEDLRAVSTLVHAAVPPRPVLRKDFVIDEYQLVEARAAGADAVLLIVAALDDDRLERLHHTAHALGLEVLVEIHDEWELERALAVGATLIGINNRDLRSFTVTLDTAERLAPLLPAGATIVGESGITNRADVERLGRAGVHAVLVGETLMRAPDRVVAVRELLA